MPVVVTTGGAAGEGPGDGEVTPNLRPIPSSGSLIFGRTMSTSFSLNDLSPSPSFSARPSQSDFSTPWDTAMSKELSRQLRSMNSTRGTLRSEPMFLCDERHDPCDEALASAVIPTQPTSSWRMKDRMKTTSVAIIMCLNIGVDPPDVLKVSPCARAECWIEPSSMQPQKALDSIGKALQSQYERWQPRARYKLQLDPTVDDVRKLCLSCRRNAKGERVLVHFNGHGVPRPTANGEIWLFNKSYTQYIPLSIFDLQAWTGSPSIYVFDCSSAGAIVNAYNQYAETRGPDASGAFADGSDEGRARNPSAAAILGLTGADGAAAAAPGSAGGTPAPEEFASSSREVIMLAACTAEQILPQSPDLPADVFTACLTSPMKMALRWFCLHSPLRTEAGLDPALADSIPGQQSNRKTPLGELNWIFTAITDTIAWNVLPRPLFQRLFRQDLLVASLFRNYLLAERILRTCGCTPVSSPRLPATHGHPMWHAWDLAVEACMLQLPGILMTGGQGQPAEFVPSPFFTDQLTAFEVWLEQGSERKAPPEQLPIVLQVLLSQSHRLRALVLLGRFLDKGPWAVDLALSVGIFPYVLKLLQTTATDLRNILVFIWTKIMAQDLTCQGDLVKDSGFTYFIRFLDAKEVDGKERALAAFVLACICDNHPRGQQACAQGGMLGVCLNGLATAAASPAVGSPTVESPTGDVQLVVWLLLALGKLWENCPTVQQEAFREGVPERLGPLLYSAIPEVRSAAVFALGALVLLPGGPEGSIAGGGGGAAAAAAAAALLAEDPALAEQRPISERAVAAQLLPCAADPSDIVRVEACVALSRFAATHITLFRAAATSAARASRNAATAGGHATSAGSAGSVGAGGSGDIDVSGSLDRRLYGSLTQSVPRPTAAGIAASAAAAAGAVGSIGRAGQGGGGGGGAQHSVGSRGHTVTMSYLGNAGGFSAGTTPGSWGGKAMAEASGRGAGGVGSALGSHHDLAGVQVVPVPEGAPSTSASLFTPRPPPFTVLGPGGAEGSSPPGVFASADAARIGGGLYSHILEALIGLALDPSPRVSEAGRAAIKALGVDRLMDLGRLCNGGGGGPGAGGGAGPGSEGTSRQSRRGSWLDRTDELSRSVGSNGDGANGGGASVSGGAAMLAAGAGGLLQRVSSWVGGIESGSAGARRRSERFAGASFSPGPGGDGGAPGRRQSGEHSGANAAGPSVNGGFSFPVVGSVGRPGASVGGAARADASAAAGAEGSASRRGSSNAAALLATGIDNHAQREREPPRILPSSRVFSDGVARMGRPLLASPSAGSGCAPPGVSLESAALDDAAADGNVHAPWTRRADPEEVAARRASAAARAQRTAGGPSLKLTEHLGWLNTEGATSNPALAFLPMDPVLAAADNVGIVRVWNYSDGPQAVTAKFRACGTSKGVASMHLVNPLDPNPLLLCGSPDGVVRVWRDFTGLPACGGRQPALAAAWRALPGVLPTRRAPQAPAAFSYQQESGCLFVAGEGAGGGSGHGLHVWDLAKELCADALLLSTLAADAHVTCLSSASGSLLLAGASDGRLLTFDLRTPAKLISSCRIHTTSVRGVQLQTGGHPNSVVTAGVGGDIIWSDLRNLLEPLSIVEAHRGGLTALASHPAAPLVASGAGERCIKLFDLSGRAISLVKYQNSFLFGHRIGAVRTLAFHPNLPILAAGATDAIVSVYGWGRAAMEPDTPPLSPGQ